MKVIKIGSEKARVKEVKKLLESVGNHIGNVWFFKRSDGEKRKMSYRIHVRKPSYASVPHSNKIKANRKKDIKNTQMTVFDVNKVRYNNKGRICGRGEWRSIPLESVIRVAANGEHYKVIC